MTTRTLADGNEIPLLGLGVWQVSDGKECEDSVRWALELGYRHIDTAQAYGNERSVGKALRDSGVPREDVYLTTKFYPARKDAEAEDAMQDAYVQAYTNLSQFEGRSTFATWARRSTR